MGTNIAVHIPVHSERPIHDSRRFGTNIVAVMFLMK
jgi:hypothetical protein